MKSDTLLFLKSLMEEGIHEVYLPTAPRPPAAPNTEPDALSRLRQTVLQCVQCSELSATRKTVVFGTGNPRAQLMFVGEAPGREEDEQGLPFVGAAGQLLTKIIESIGLTRRDVFIANVLKCRPPGNRPPRPEEILNCRPYLMEQIALIRPKIICALGNFAAAALLQTGSPISQLRGRFYELAGARVRCTFHPAYLLRNPEEKRKVWEDMKAIKKELEPAAAPASP